MKRTCFLLREEIFYFVILRNAKTEIDTRRDNKNASTYVSKSEVIECGMGTSYANPCSCRAGKSPFPVSRDGEVLCLQPTYANFSHSNEKWPLSTQASSWVNLQVEISSCRQPIKKLRSAKAVIYLAYACTFSPCDPTQKYDNFGSRTDLFIQVVSRYCDGEISTV